MAKTKKTRRAANSSNSIPSTIWVARVNLSGLYSSNPIPAKLVVGRDYEGAGNSWVTTNGDFHICRIGVEKKSGYVTFSSESKAEVECFLQGVKSTMHLLSNWAKLP